MKYPGEIPNPELEDWFGQASSKVEPNPCVRLYGPGPAGEKCKNCRLFLRRGGNTQTYFKCLLRGVTSGPASDHRANWAACKRFVQT